MLEERSRPRRQDGVGVVGGGEGTTGWVGQQGVWGQALGVCMRGGRCVRGAVRQVCEGVRVDSRRDVGVRSQQPIVAVPLFVAVV